jgi:hypothetical protein
MKKKYDYIKYLNRCTKTNGTLGGSGLCRDACIGHLNKGLLDMFKPTEEDKKWLMWDKHDTIFWGSEDCKTKCGELTSLRLTIVLFMAAINKQL